jgi:hypothetical protein
MSRWIAFLGLLLPLVIGSSASAECLAGNCKDGEGTSINRKGHKYVGIHQNGKAHGQGTVTYANGDKYVGESKNGLKHGQGTYVWTTTGDRYVGAFQDGKMSGLGTMKWGPSSPSHGDTYTGEWKNDARNGRGTYYQASGRIVNGTFKDNAFLEVLEASIATAWFVPDGYQPSQAKFATTNRSEVPEEIARVKQEERLKTLAAEKRLAELESQMATRASYSVPQIGTIDEGPRTALVIGNANYTSSPLRNPANDATDMATVLRRLSFEVDLLTDASKRQMAVAIADFGRRSRFPASGAALSATTNRATSCRQNHQH